LFSTICGKEQKQLTYYFRIQYLQCPGAICLAPIFQYGITILSVEIGILKIQASGHILIQRNSIHTDKMCLAIQTTHMHCPSNTSDYPQTFKWLTVDWTNTVQFLEYNPTPTKCNNQKSCGGQPVSTYPLHTGNNKGTDKFILENTMKAHKESKGIALLFPEPQHYMEVGGQCHAPITKTPPTPPPGGRPSAHCMERCGKPRPHSDSIPWLSSPYCVDIPTTIPHPTANWRLLKLVALPISAYIRKNHVSIRFQNMFSCHQPCAWFPGFKETFLTYSFVVANNFYYGKAVDG
jgi:hypothetical protein